MNNKTYLMTGGTGFLGIPFSIDLIREGNKVIFLGRSKDGKNFHNRIKESLLGFDKTLPLDSIETLEMDMSKKNLGLPEKVIEELKNKKINGFWHLAANLSFRNKDREELFSTNISGLENILEFVENINTTIFYISTAYVHGQRKGILKENDLIFPKKFNNPYEESKFKAEKIIKNWARKESSNKYIIFRPSILIKPNEEIKSYFGYYAFVLSIYNLKKNIQKFTESHKILSKLLLIQNQEGKIKLWIPFFYTKNAYLNLIPVNTVVKWMILISNNPNSRQKTFQLTNPNPFPMEQITKQTFKALDVKMPLFKLPKWIVLLFFNLIFKLSKIIKPLSDVSKKIYYFKFYMTENMIFDTKNTQEFLGSEFKKDTNFEQNFIEHTAKNFIGQLK